MGLPMQGRLRRALHLLLSVQRDCCVDATRARQVRGARMRIWMKKPETESSGRGVARAALSGASRKELLQEALKALALQGPAGRFGGWVGGGLEAQPRA